jgi:hypothetical protein
MKRDRLVVQFNLTGIDSFCKCAIRLVTLVQMATRCLWRVASLVAFLQKWSMLYKGLGETKTNEPRVFYYFLALDPRK